MDNQRLRNLTTGILHTEVGYIYEDLGDIIGDTELMTHMLPRAMKAIEPWLRDKVKDPLFWDNKYNPAHVGDFNLTKPTKEDQKIFLERFCQMPNPLVGKAVKILQTD